MSIQSNRLGVFILLLVAAVIIASIGYPLIGLLIAVVAVCVLLGLLG